MQIPLSLIEDLLRDVRDGIVRLPNFARRTAPKEIWFEIAFCISSSQERTSRAQHAARCLADGYEQLVASPEPRATIKALLESDFISLRFANRKVDQLAESWRVFLQELPTLQSVDRNFPTPAEARSYIVENFAGLGPKQSSMLLRNIGFGADLAIIDSHVARMSEIILEDPPPPSKYSALEESLREYAKMREVSLLALDVVLWNCSRIARSYRREAPLLV